MGVDLVVLTVIDAQLHVLLTNRDAEPFADLPALPGGLVRPEENLDEAVTRELTEETGLARLRTHQEQVRSYGEVGRDPRGRVVSVAYLVLAPGVPYSVSGRNGRGWTPIGEALTLRLAFDHALILADGLERARARLEYTSLATAFCPAKFTVAELREVYEAVWGQPLDPRNFHRKMTGTPGLLIECGELRREGPGRPATLYRAGETRVLNPPFVRDR